MNWALIFLFIALIIGIGLFAWLPYLLDGEAEKEKQKNPMLSWSDLKLQTIPGSWLLVTSSPWAGDAFVYMLADKPFGRDRVYGDLSAVPNPDLPRLNTVNRPRQFPNRITPKAVI